MMSRSPLALAFAALLLLPYPGASQVASSTGVNKASRSPAAAGPRVVRSTAITGQSPTIDGRLDDPAWAAAEPATGFVQMRPEPGTPASQATEARVIYGADAIYVGMRMHDSHPDSIAAQLARRDASGVYSDWAHVLIDSYHDRRTGFRFSVNPRGVKKDVLHFDDHNEDINWDAVWEVGTQVDSAGWTAEFRIPLSQLRYSAPAGGERVWGVNFSREIARRGEWSWWSPVLPNNGAGTVSQSGELHGLQGIRSARRLEVLPYSVARLTRAPGEGENPFYSANDGSMAMGVDLRYGITSNLTLSATLNPDFGQVEADPSQVNLSAYESYFAEKRPFFMEGSNIFAFNVGTDDGSGESLFYSRRIGRTPQRWVDQGDGWKETPEATTILGAAKVTGKTAGGWTLGLLNAVTGEETARLADRDGAITREAVEPLTNYLVGSLSREFRQGRSGVGIMATATHRRLDGREEFGFLRSAAYTAGINGRHRFAGGNWEANGYLAGSHILGSEEAILRVQTGSAHYFQRPDADYVEVDSTRTSLSGAVASFWVGKNGGSKLRGGFGGHWRSPGLELNDLGFMGEADQRQLFASWRWQQYEPQGIFRSWSVGINPFSMWTNGGERIYTQLGHWANYELKSFWNGGWWMGRRFEALSNGSLRGGPAIVRPGGFRYSTWISSDRRKPLGVHLNVSGGFDDEGGGWDYGVGPSVSYRPSSQVNLSVSPSYRRNSSTWQYVTQRDGLGSRRYVLSHLDQTTVSVTTRLNYTISPTLSLELYAQPFVSAGDYSGFMEVVDPRAARFGDRFRKFGDDEISLDPAAGRYAVDLDGDRTSDFTFGDPDFNFKQLRSNAVLRWEYRPGSTLFVVWSQGRTDYLPDGTFGFGRDFGRLMGFDDDHPVPSTNVFLVKFSYWLNL